MTLQSWPPSSYAHHVFHKNALIIDSHMAACLYLSFTHPFDPLMTTAINVFSSLNPLLYFLEEALDISGDCGSQQ